MAQVSSTVTGKLQSALNPLDRFPSKSDRVVGVLYGIEPSAPPPMAGDTSQPLKTKTSSILSSTQLLGQRAQMSSGTIAGPMTRMLTGGELTIPVGGERWEKWKSQSSKKNHEYGITGLEQPSDYGGVTLQRIQEGPMYSTMDRAKVSLGELHNNSLHGPPVLAGEKTRKDDGGTDKKSIVDGINLPSTQRAKLKNRFLLVEEVRLSELTKFEQNLRRENESIGENFAWILNDFQVNFHEPTPAARVAMGNICENEQRRLSDEIIKLEAEWKLHCKQNHYNKPHLYTKETYLHNAPVEEAKMKLKLVREAAANWAVRKERDSMIFEDDHSYLFRAYIDAKVRKQDYDRYFVLATRYGQFSAEEFAADSRPGRRYFIKVTDAALKFQRAWDRYWAIIKLRRYRSARAIQTRWRGYWKFKNINPLIKLRLKFGKRTYYIYSWYQWTRYNTICRKIRTQILIYKQNLVKECYMAWKGWLAKKTERKKLILRRIVMRLSAGALCNCFFAWAGFAKKSARVKRYLRRLFKCPQWEVWLKYVAVMKEKRRLGGHATYIQAMIRCFNTRTRFLKYKMAHGKIREWWHFVFIVRTMRKLEIQKSYEVWKPLEIERRIQTKIDNERRRVARQILICAEKEATNYKTLRRHLLTRAGKSQIRELAYEIRKRLTTKSRRWRKVWQMAEKELADRCSNFTKIVELHDFETRSPPGFKCPDIKCQCISPTAELHIEHCKTSNNHMREFGENFGPFFVMVRHPRGLEHVRNYLLKRHGFSTISNCFDFWAAVQDWRKSHTTTDTYHNKGMTIYESFLRPSGTRYIGIEFPGSFDTLESLFLVKTREYKGMYKVTNASPSWWRYLCGFVGAPYKKWSEENMLSPIAFSEAEWVCFKKVYFSIEADGGAAFHSSPEWKLIQKCYEEEAAQQLVDLFNDYKKERMDKILDWSHDFKKRELEMIRMSGEVADHLLSAECQFLFHAKSTVAVNEVVFDVQHDEQDKYETLMSIIDDALFWTEENCLNSIWDFFVSALLVEMLEHEDLVKGMLEYAGMARGGLKKALVVDVTKRVDDSWYEPWFQNCLLAEKKLIPIPQALAIERLQRMFRGILARNRVRLLISTQYLKKFDADAQLYFYFNLKTETASWERPILFNRLFPRSNW